MKSILAILSVMLLNLSAYGASQEDTSKDGASKDKPLLMAHYMPWFLTKEGSGAWGYHWTMNHFKPDQVDAKGMRQIASHYYPLIGAYDSNDADVLEYHVLLMKFSGIDGVIVDWYGMEKVYDYAQIHRNTQHLIKHLDKAGLKYAICYEDSTIKEMVRLKHIAQKDDISHAQGVLKWLEANWFRNAGYVKCDERPLFLVFGPQYFKKDEWESIFSPLAVKPHFFPEDNLLPSASGTFPWPPMWASEEGVLKPKRLREYLKESYTKAKNYKYSIGAAFPRYHDIYSKEFNHDSYGYLDARNGRTYEETLESAIKSKANIVQIVTWNEFGEGTIIEPTKETGYKYLEMTQTIRKREFDSSFKWTPEHLRIPHQLYLLRKKHKGNQAVERKLDEAANLFFKNKLSEGAGILKDVK